MNASPLKLLAMAGALSALSLIPALASDPPQGGTLSLQDCVKIALNGNPNLQAFLHSGRGAMARIGNSRSAYWPDLTLGGGMARGYSESSGNGILSSSSPYTSDYAQLQSQYTLWDSGVRKSAVGSAEASYKASDASYHATAQDLALQVESSYYALEGAMWNYQVAQDTRKQTQFHFDMAKAQNKVGLVAMSDVLQAETADANAALAEIQTESAVTSNRASLAVLMGWPADSSFEIERMDASAPLPSLPDWASGKDRALKSLPEIEAAFQNSEALRYSLKQVKASYLPSVTLDGSYGRQDAGSWPNLETWSLGFSFHVPLFTGFARKYQVIDATEAWEGSKMSLQSTKLVSERAAYEARIQMQTALKSVEAAEVLVRSAQENSDVAEGQYKNGLGSMTNVVDATTALNNAKLQLVSARLSSLTALAAWNRTTGLDMLEGISLPATSAPSEKDGETKP